MFTARLIDPTTHNSVKDTYYIDVLNTTVSDFSPPIPPNIAFTNARQEKPPGVFKVTEDQVTGITTHESALTGTDLGDQEKHRARIIACETIARAAVAHTDGMIATKPEFQRYVTSLIDTWASAKRKEAVLGGVYGGRRLFNVTRSTRDRSHHISPTDSVQGDIQGSLPWVHVKSMNRLYVVPVLDEITNIWLETGDVRKAWLAGYEKADAANCCIALGGPPPSTCNCSAPMSPTAVHHCCTCGKETICNVLEMGIYGFRVCPHCRHMEQREDFGMPETIAQRLVYRQLLHEADRNGERIDGKQVQAEIKAVKAEIKKWFESDPNLFSRDSNDEKIRTTKWYDGYTGTYREMSSDALNTPYELSVDAGNPYGIGCYGMTRYHASDNIELTCRALNFGKNCQLPIFLRYLAWYLEELEKILNEQEGAMSLDRLQHTMVRISETLRKIRIKAGWTKAARSNNRISGRKYQYDLEQFRSGKLRPKDKDPSRPWNKPKYSAHFGNASNEPDPAAWPADVIARVKARAQELQKEFAVTLPAVDGCPWFGHARRIPIGWNWATAAKLMAERYYRLKYWCNGRDTTYDTPDTLFLDCIFGACVQKCVIAECTGEDKTYTTEEKLAFKARYCEFLGLPLVADTVDGLCFVLAHAEHKMPMFSGWAPEPSSIRDRDDGANNLLLETKTSNFLKHDFDQSHYSGLKELVKSVRLSKSWLDTSEGRLADVPDDMEDDLTAVKAEEALDFEDVTSQATEAFTGDALDPGQFTGESEAPAGEWDTGTVEESAMWSGRVEEYEAVQALVLEKGVEGNKKVQDGLKAMEDSIEAGDDYRYDQARQFILSHLT